MTRYPPSSRGLWGSGHLCLGQNGVQLVPTGGSRQWFASGLHVTCAAGAWSTSQADRGRSCPANRGRDLLPVLSKGLLWDLQGAQGDRSVEGEGVHESQGRPTGSLWVPTSPGGESPPPSRKPNVHNQEKALEGRSEVPGLRA